MFMLYKIEARLSHAQVRVSRTLEGFFKQYIPAYLSVGCIGNESVNKI